MNILVIGNGFDLAHGLKTKYEDFLKFTQTYTKYDEVCRKRPEIKEVWEAAPEEEKYILLHMKNMFDQNKNLYEELGSLIKHNVWLKYFYSIYESRKQEGKDGWIDFESEISQVIQTLDAYNLDIENGIREGKYKVPLNQRGIDILKPFIGESDKGIGPYMFHFGRDFINCKKRELFTDLKRLIRCLEIYLCEFVMTVDVKELYDITKLPIMDKVLSFNYTDTYEKIYKPDSNVEFDYIHGKADINRTVENNNMVLGVDEYLQGDDRNQDIEFIEFKKYFQRIHKETGCKYRKWLKQMESDTIYERIINPIYRSANDNVIYTKKEARFHQIFFYGHSLDITDKDIIKALILAKRTHTIIYYLDKEDYARKITNLVKIIGQDELISRTGGADRSIFFKEITRKCEGEDL